MIQYIVNSLPEIIRTKTAAIFLVCGLILQITEFKESSEITYFTFLFSTNITNTHIE